MKSVALVFLSLVSSLLAGDWPRWMGEKADGKWRESGVRVDLPAKGAPVVWRAKVGWGYSGPAVVGDRVYVGDFLRTKGELTNNPGKAVSWEGTERLLCLDAKTGKELWTHERKLSYKLSYPGGPRCTPTVAVGKVYYLGAMGHLVCVDALNGRVIWEKDFQKDFEAPLPIWGFSAHPLVDKGVVYCVVGGEGQVAMAFDAMTGEKKWSALSARSQGYCPPAVIRAGGVDQLLIWHPAALSGMNPETGEVYWDLPLKPNYGMSVMTPLVLGNRLFASGIGRVGAMIELGEDKPTAKFAWKGRPKTAVYCCNSTPIAVDGVIYGADIDTSQLVAFSPKKGKRFWQTQEPVMAEKHRKGGRHGTIYVTYNEPTKKFWLYNESGDLILADLSKEGYKELGRQHLLEPTNEAFGRPVVWSAPAFADKSVFVRNDKELIRVNLAE